MTAMRTIFMATMMTLAAQANAHSGGLDKNGCHAGSKPYHCHRAQAAAPPKLQRRGGIPRLPSARLLRKKMSCICLLNYMVTLIY
jgi:hypothetical protein